MADRLFPSDNQAQRLTILSVLSEMHHCRPGKILEFDLDANLAKVQAAIQLKFTGEGKAEYIDPPEILRVPVVVLFSPSAGVCVTVPIREGDPCLLLFSDRFIDNFVDSFKKGGKPVKPECCGADNVTSEPRMCHMTDAICLPGLYGQPDRIPHWNNDAVEMRTHDGRNYIRLGTGDYGIRLTSGGGFDAGGSDIRMKDGIIWFYGAEKIITRTKVNRTEIPPAPVGETGEPTMPE